MLDLKKLSERELRNYHQKVTYQHAKFKNLQLAKKIQLNSAYGACGNQYFRFYDIRLAEAITMSGQLAIRWIERKVNEFLNKILRTEKVDYVLAIDTDSIYLTMDKLVQKIYKDKIPKDKEKIVQALERFSKDVLADYINESYRELADYLNAYAQKMQMGLEVIADKGFWTAKKRYALNVFYSEGVYYSVPHLKIMGLETQRTTTPEYCREKLKEAIRIVLQKDEEAIIEYVKKIGTEFKQQRIEDIAIPKGVNNLQKYTDSICLCAKGCPIHVRGSIVYNHFREQLELESKYQEIKEGEKIRYVYCKLPNPIKQHVISFVDVLPEEFGMRDYIDYDTQFEKVFKQPLEAILNTIGWSSEKKVTMSSFYC
jgi:DNA polymerase elongation subunit (family B)